ncbi:MAG: glycosyltransferase family 2 protein [Candidatus Saccharibacteria bacterium]
MLSGPFATEQFSNLSSSGRLLLSIVVPVYNEAVVLEEFHRRVSGVCDQLEAQCELIYVNDGSQDNSLAIMRRLHTTDDRVSIINLSRNFGKEIALTAGLDHAGGDAVILIDADLQDPPELIPELVRGWQDGFDVVYATRTARSGETLLKRATAHAFYRFIERISRVPIPQDTGDFRLLSRRAVESLRRLREQHRFMKGLFAWIGYPHKAVPYHRDPRFAGRTKWNYRKLWNLAIEGVTSFSIGPLKVSTYFGFTIALSAFLYASWIILKTILFGEPVRGYPTLMVTVLFFSGIQLIAIGVLGEYIGRIFNETKGRPLYLTDSYLCARLRAYPNNGYSIKDEQKTLS